nr:hypothetical protein GCM10020092_023070 [Actinoplanes digitatis]
MVLFLHVFSHRVRRIAVVVAILLAPLAPGFPGPAAQASFGISQRLGFDACMPTVSQMQAFWSNTPFSNFGLYIGGADLGCPSTPDASWLSRVQAMGWQFMPIWVGPQAPCSSEPVRMSWDTGTARQQGRNEALAAYRRMVALGMNTTSAPVVFDLENYNTADSACVNAVKSFVQGWVEQMHVAPAQKAGVYGSTCASGLSRLAEISTPPDFVTGAAWDGNRNTGVMPCVDSGLWTNHQRHKQYAGDHNETWNGVTLNIDSDCSNAPVYPGPDQLNTGQGCVGAALQSAPRDAALVTPRFGWLLTGDELLLSHDGGDTFAPAKLHLPGGGAQAALFRDERRGWVASAGPGGITVARTSTGAATWSTTTIPTNSGIGALRLAFRDANHGALLAQIATSKAFSRAELFTTADGGATWTARTAPVVGDIAVDPDGRLRLTGGVGHDEVYTSTDDGRGWRRGASTRAFATTGAARTTYADQRTGWTLASTGSCANGKRDCSIGYDLEATTDGGSTWRPIRQWQQRVN